MANGQAHAGCLAQHLRITVFPSGTLPGTDDLWQRLAGQEPETAEYRRTEALRRQAGPVGEGELEVRTQPTRVDVVMKPLTTDIAMPKLHLGPFGAVAGGLLDLARPWLSDPGGDIVRVAFAGTVLYRATDRAESYALFAQYVPSVKVDAEHTKEVQYRVNRPKESKHGITFNRITTWAPISLRVEATSAGSKTIQISQEHFLQFQFDNNTPAERTEPLEQDTIIPIFEELLAMARKNAFQGECL